MVFSLDAATSTACKSDRTGPSRTGMLGGRAPHAAAGFAALPDRFGCRPGPARQAHRRRPGPQFQDRGFVAEAIYQRGTRLPVGSGRGAGTQAHA